MRAIVMEEPGGPEVLELRDLDAPVAGPGQVTVDVAAAGVNFMDTGVRRGYYGVDVLPLVPGIEGAGTITTVGPGVDPARIGDRVAWFFGAGSYAEQIAIDEAKLVPIPDDVGDEVAAGLLMQGLTAHHLVTATYAVQPGDVVLVHAAAGGLGLLLTQLVKERGGVVIGAVSTPEKAAISRAAGAAHALVYGEDDIAAEAQRITGGIGVAAAFDGGGAATFPASLAALRLHGTLAYYGQTVERVLPIDLATLPKSILVSFPVVHHHVTTRDDLLRHGGELFDLVARGALTVSIGARFDLGDAKLAHAAIESRGTTGKILLLP